MRILAIDPGNTEGRAEFENGYCINAYPSYASSVAEKYAHLVVFKPDLVVIEDQFSRFGNVKSFKTLLLERAKWQVLALLQGIKVEIVAPSTWMAHIKAHKKPNKEAIIRKTASETFGATVSSIDACCAVCIGKWYMEVKANENQTTIQARTRRTVTRKKSSKRTKSRRTS